jgi:DNA-binding transcriptional MerR regulator
MAKTFDYKTWWEKNKEERNAIRRAKYRQDPRYRETQKERFRAHYLETRQNIEPVDRRTVVSGAGRLYVTIGRVARLIGRQTNSIRRYHKMGVIPEPRFYDARGWRLYTPSQTELMRNVFSRFDNANDDTIRTLGDVRRALEAGWMESTPIEEVASGTQEAAVEGRRSRTSRGRGAH